MSIWQKIKEAFGIMDVPQEQSTQAQQEPQQPPQEPTQIPPQEQGEQE